MAGFGRFHRLGVGNDGQREQVELYRLLCVFGPIIRVVGMWDKLHPGGGGGWLIG